MTLHKKHILALEDKDFCKKEATKIIAKIETDSSGSCWHIKEVSNYTLKQAEKLDKLSFEEKIKMPLFGLSVGIKDLFCIKGLTTTAGSKILDNFVSPYDSKVWSTLESKGALLGAKLAMDEFAMGSFSNTSYLGKVSIPGYSEHTAGGSSGGSGAALKADIVDFTVGSDTGGSVRLPASYCSVVGYKPSYGVFSRHGMIAYASSLDQAGFLTHSIEDLKYLLDSGISEKDKHDMSSKGLLIENSKENKKTFRVGYFPEFFKAIGISSSVAGAYENCIKKLIESGIEVIPVKIPLMEKAAQIYYILACSEASSNLAKYQGIYFGKKLVDENFEGSFWEQAAQYRSKYFGLEVQKRIMLGSYILSSENFSSMYQKACKLRIGLKEQFKKVFQEVDTLVLPVSPIVAPKWDEIEKMTSAEIYLSDFMTVPFSLAGLPALSVPWYKDEQGLGIGMQWVGQYMKDYELIKSISTIEKILGK